jgi:hypothetical protein
MCGQQSVTQIAKRVALTKQLAKKSDTITHDLAAKMSQEHMTYFAQ